MIERAHVSLTVAVTSVGRTKDLALNLASLFEQTDRPERIIVVAQASDLDTQEMARQFGVDVVVVPESGVARAVEAAILAAETEVIAFVDDDARALPDWTCRIRESFREDPTLGLLGGRDNVNGDRRAGTASLRVGVIRRGRLIGNHHLGHGPARPSSHVKGANMSMRVAPARTVPLTALVHGDGAQARSELMLSLGILNGGYTGRYDPSIQVDHFPALRRAGDERTRHSFSRVRLQRLNETLALSIYGSRGQLFQHLVWNALVGDRNCYGVVQAIRRLAAGDRTALSRLAGSLNGLGAGLGAARRLARTATSSSRSGPLGRARVAPGGTAPAEHD